MTRKPEVSTQRHLRERRIDGRRVYEGHVISVDVDRVCFDDGEEAIREVVRHPGAVVIVALTDDRHLIVERQFRYPAGEELLELPAGKLLVGEDPLACARRELAEETGYSAPSWQLLGTFFTAPGFSDEKMFAFLALDAVPGTERKLDDDERLDVLRLTVPDVQGRVLRGEIRDAKSISSLFLASLSGAL